jgi:hypothetical protein
MKSIKNTAIIKQTHNILALSIVTCLLIVTSPVALATEYKAATVPTVNIGDELDEPEEVTICLVLPQLC